MIFRLQAAKGKLGAKVVTYGGNSYINSVKPDLRCTRLSAPLTLRNFISDTQVAPVKQRNRYVTMMWSRNAPKYV